MKKLKSLLWNRRFFLFLGWLGLVVFSILYLKIFLDAYLNPSFIYELNINLGMEAHYEFWMNLVLVPFLICFIYESAKWIVKGDKN